MKIRHIIYHSRCNRRIKKLHELKEVTRKRVAIFRENCFDPRLKTHKLHGEMSHLYAFSINHKYRIIFEIIGEGIVHFIDIGTHSIYD